MNTVIYFLLTIGYVVLLIWGLVLSRKNVFSLTNVLLLVILALIYDNFIIAIGRYIGAGNLLEQLSYPHYWLHALFTPTLILFAWSICSKLNLAWAKKSIWKILFSLLTLALILYELFTSVMGLRLKTKEERDVLTYESVEAASPVMVILVIIVLLLVGIILMRKLHFKWLFVGTIVSIIGNLLAIWIKTFPLMNIIEFLLIFSLVITKHFQVKITVKA
ncbi:MAG TPA: hypothetical protein VNS08_11315 [Ureibacillus sp.]|nr:hypothetical protein [Ureibacillus sp.]